MATAPWAPQALVVNPPQCSKASMMMIGIGMPISHRRM
jgi:hypothetical protein